MTVGTDMGSVDGRRVQVGKKGRGAMKTGKRINAAAACGSRGPATLCT